LLLILHLLVILNGILVTHKLVVLSLILIDLLQEVLDGHVLPLNLFHESISIIASALLKIIDSLFVLSDLDLKCLHFFSLVIDFLKENDVFRHDLVVVFLVDLLVFLEHLSQVVDVVFEVSALTGVFTVKIGVASLVLDLFLHVFLVKADDASLELFEVSDVMEAIEHVIFELLLEALLLIELGPEILDLVSETLLSHSEIVDDQGQVLVDSVEVSELLSHLVGLLIELLDVELPWPNISLQLLDLVVEHELELLKLLGLLLEVNDSVILVLDGSISFLELTNLTLDLLLEISCILVQVRDLLILHINLLLFAFPFGLGLSEVVVDESQLAFGLHTLIDDFGELFLVLILQDVDLVPGVFLD